MRHGRRYKRGSRRRTTYGRMKRRSYSGRRRGSRRLTRYRVSRGGIRL